MKIVIHDAMSSLRVRLEQKLEPAHMLVRGVLNDAMAPGRFTVWVWDAKGGNDRRRKIFPGYKTRASASNDTYAALRLLQELLSMTPCYQAWLDGFEGDDVIAALVDHFRPQGLPIEIVTRDGDLTALCGPGVTCGAPCKAPPHLVRLWKLCLGDKSDTIPGIRGFGPKTWDECPSYTRLQELLDRIADRRPWEDDEAIALGISKASTKWLRENPGDLAAMRTIIAPFPMTKEELAAALKPGVDNPAAREAALQRYLM